MEKSDFKIVYAFQTDSGKVKIGFAASVEERMRSLKTAMYEGIRVLHSVKCSKYRQVEKAAHENLFEKRIANEWFDCSAQEAIDSINHSIAQVGADVLDGDCDHLTRIQVMLSNSEYGVLMRLVKADQGHISRSAVIRRLVVHRMLSGSVIPAFDPPVEDGNRPQRVQTMLSVAELAMVDDWRSQYRPIPSKSDAVRRLLLACSD